MGVIVGLIVVEVSSIISGVVVCSRISSSSSKSCTSSSSW